MASSTPFFMASSALLSGPQRPFTKATSLSPFRVRRNPNPRFLLKFPISASLDPSASSSSWEREEVRWVREEKRWIREEERWMREESRWRSERESLLAQVAALRHHIDALERRRTPPEATASEEGYSPPLLAEDAESSPPLLAEKADVKEMILEGARIRVSEVDMEKREEKPKKRTLRMGSEGEEVREMQEALLGLGFYSGEEDMEFSSFSSGTERAVKTWQASLGTSEDGIMTSELLERLLTNRSPEEYANQGGDSVSETKKGGTNGAAVASLTEIAEIQQTVVKESGHEEVEVSGHRVFLLGENRWEEPSRLLSRNKPAGGSKVVSATKCLTCRGEGRLMCTECDGSGEPNIEPQFLEWVDEGTKCSYCEGLGYTICDVCEGKKL